MTMKKPKNTKLETIVTNFILGNIFSIPFTLLMLYTGAFKQPLFGLPYGVLIAHLLWATLLGGVLTIVRNSHFFTKTVEDREDAVCALITTEPKDLTEDHKTYMACLAILFKANRSNKLDLIFALMMNPAVLSEIDPELSSAVERQRSESKGKAASKNTSESSDDNIII